MAKSKKKSLKQLDKEYRKLLIEARKETRLDTLRGLKQMMVNGITIDVAALNVMMQEVEEATTPIENFNKEYLDKLEPAGENVWVPRSNGTDDEARYSVGPLAHAFGVSKQTLTKFLRENFPDDAPGVGRSWAVTTEMVDAFARR